MSMPIKLPLRTINSLNAREHWAKRAKRASKERSWGYMFTPPGLKPPLTVLLTRIGPKPMDDDGLAAAFKNIRDGIADKVGLDDGSDKIKFKYAQKVGKHGIEIDIYRARRSA